MQLQKYRDILPSVGVNGMSSEQVMKKIIKLHKNNEHSISQAVESWHDGGPPNARAHAMRAR